MPRWRARRAANHPRATRKEHPRRIHEAKHTKKEEKKKRRKEANAGTVVSRQARMVVQRGGTREHGTTETLPIERFAWLSTTLHVATPRTWMGKSKIWLSSPKQTKSQPHHHHGTATAQPSAQPQTPPKHGTDTPPTWKGKSKKIWLSSPETARNCFRRIWVVYWRSGPGHIQRSQKGKGVG